MYDVNQRIPLKHSLTRTRYIIVMGTEDKQVAIRMFLMLIISVVLGVIVLAFGAFFALTNAMQDRDITLAGLYFGTGLEVVT
jgi:hypothetical protein